MGADQSGAGGGGGCGVSANLRRRLQVAVGGSIVEDSMQVACGKGKAENYREKWRRSSIFERHEGRHLFFFYTTFDLYNQTAIINWLKYEETWMFVCR